NCTVSDRKKYRAGNHKRKLEDLQREWSKHPPNWEEVQTIRKLMRTQSNGRALEQIWRAGPPDAELDEAERRLSEAAFYQTFLPSDGVESALSRLIIATTNGAVDCFSRAAALDTPGRPLELNLAAKLSSTAAALSKALDSHRAQDLPFFIDDLVDTAGDRGSAPSSGGEPKPGDSAPSSSEECSSSKDEPQDEPKHSKN
ncbi:MAG: hypothetical protein WBD84_11715, partial [Methyloceanibacter sp.]